jgi:hypothetical protein
MHVGLQNAIVALDRNQERPSIETLGQCWSAFLKIPTETYERYPKLRDSIASSLWFFEDNVRHDDPKGSRDGLANIALDLANYLIDIYVDGPSKDTWENSESDESIYDFLIVFESRIDPMEDIWTIDGPWDSESESSCETD